MTHPIVEYLKKHGGELPASKILIPDMTPGAVKNAVRNLYLDGFLLRREVPVEGCKEKMCLAYSLSDESPRTKLKKLPDYKKMQAFALRKEPDYAYHLRNLPRQESHCHD